MFDVVKSSCDTRCPSECDWKIEAMLFQYSKTPFVLLLRQKYVSHLTFVSREVPEGWTAYRHPDGALYFVHGESVSKSERYRISLSLYLTYNSVENVYGSEHMR